MIKDFAGLQAFLESDVDFDTAVRGKSIRPLLAQLNDSGPGTSIFQQVVSEEVLDAIGDGTRGLSAQELARLQLYTSRDEIDFTKPAIRAEIDEIFVGNTRVLASLATVSSRSETHGNVFGFDPVVKEDLWQILPNIAKSYMAVYRARG